MDLTNYLPADLLDLAVQINDEPASCNDLDLDRGIRLYLLAICPVLAGGAKILKPALPTCRVLQHVELNLGFEDYAQPYLGLGVVLPGALFGATRDRLATTVWKPGCPILMTFFDGPEQVQAGSTTTIHLKIAPPPSMTIEEYLTDGVAIEREGAFAQDVLQKTVLLARLVLNLCLFAVERGARVVPLNPRAEKRRRQARRDRRMARLSARDAQEIVIQDLDLVVGQAAPPTDGLSKGSAGWQQRMHRRRGHWKMQAHGPGRSLRRRIFVQSYMVHVDDQDGEVETILT